jgi:hypothetical protein
MSIDDDMTNWGMNDAHHAFLARFTRENGRAPRILMIGNIANNAFKNSYVLRKHGVHCDVLCYDYYHVMGCPEWELARFDTEAIEFDTPDWSRIDLGGFERPRWFAQGRLFTALDYLIALNENSDQADALWSALASERDSAGQLCEASSIAAPSDFTVASAAASRLASLYAITFPDRPAPPTVAAIESQYLSLLLENVRFKRVFAHYDVVIGYSTDGILPLMFGKRPYVCFEHGTIRTLPFEPSTVGQMCALSYACADDVLISNCDNIVAARRLKLGSFRFLPHAMLEDGRTDPAVPALRQSLLDDHNADFIIFHPSRQHWSATEDLNWEKGNDRLIKAFARFVGDTRPSALLIMVEWGQHVEASRALVEQLGISKRVVWLKPRPMVEVGQYVAAADVLADQFVIGAWGAIMPHGMMLGLPTMLYVNEDVHKWCFPQMPPVLNARNEVFIYKALVLSTSQDYKNYISVIGPEWYNKYHSENIVAGRLFDSFISVLLPAEYDLMSRKFNELRAEIHSNTHSVNYLIEQYKEYNLNQELLSAIVPLGRMTRAKNWLRRLKEKFPVLGGALFHCMRLMLRSIRWLVRPLLRMRGSSQ